MTLNETQSVICSTINHKYRLYMAFNKYNKRVKYTYWWYWSALELIVSNTCDAYENFAIKVPLKFQKNCHKAFQGSVSIKGRYNNGKVNNSKTPLRITRGESSRVLAIQFQLHWHYLLTNTRGASTRTGRTYARDGSHSDTGWQGWYDMRVRLTAHQSTGKLLLKIASDAMNNEYLLYSVVFPR